MREACCGESTNHVTDYGGDCMGSSSFAENGYRPKTTTTAATTQKADVYSACTNN